MTTKTSGELELDDGYALARPDRGVLHLKAPDGTPMADVMLTLMHKLGLDNKSFGDSTGEFSLSI